MGDIRIEHQLTWSGTDEDFYRTRWPRKSKPYVEWRSELSEFDIEFWTFGGELRFIEGSKQCPIPSAGSISFLGRFRNDTRDWTGGDLCTYINGTYVMNELCIEPLKIGDEEPLFRLIYKEEGKPDQSLLDKVALTGLAKAADETYQKLLAEIARDYPWTRDHAGYNELLARLEPPDPETPGSVIM